MDTFRIVSPRSRAMYYAWWLTHSGCGNVFFLFLFLHMAFRARSFTSMVLLLALCSLAKAVFVIIDFESSMVKSIFSCLPCSLNVVVVVNIIIVIGFVSYHVRSYPLFYVYCSFVLTNLQYVSYGNLQRENQRTSPFLIKFGNTIINISHAILDILLTWWPSCNESKSQSFNRWVSDACPFGFVGSFSFSFFHFSSRML